MKSTYERAVEGMPERIRLAREIRSLFKPADFYAPKYHKFRPSPEEQIKHAFALTGDAKPYLRNRDLYRRLYDVLRAAQIPHHDVASIWADPYLETVKRWDTLPEQRKSSLLKEYPEMAGVSTFLTQTKREFR